VNPVVTGGFVEWQVPTTDSGPGGIADLDFAFHRESGQQDRRIGVLRKQISRGDWPRLRSFLLRNLDVSKGAYARDKRVNQACCQCGYRGDIGNGIDEIKALQPLGPHLQIMDRTDLGQKAAQRLNMDRADSLVRLGKLFRGFSGHFDQF
jgi:hypothetical protein